MEQATGYEFVDAEEVHAMLKAGRNQALIDTLPDDHFARVHLPGAENACVYQVNFVERMADLVPERDRKIVLYGSSGSSRDAVAAAEKLVRAGYRHIAVLNGGLRTWRDKGFPLEGSSPEDPDEPTRVLISDGEYTVDVSASMVEWAGRNPNVKHHGTLRLSGGVLHVRDGDVTGSFTLDMRSITNINLEGDALQPVLLAHLRSDDFFFVDSYPTAVFKIESARLVDETLLSGPNWSVKGSLTLRGVTLPLPLMATLGSLASGGFAAEAHFDIDRTQWNVIYGSSRFYEHLGMHLVFDLISVQVRIVAHCKTC